MNSVVKKDKIMSVILGIDPSAGEVKKVFVKFVGKDANISKSAKSDKIVATIPSNYLTFRKFNLPLRDRKKINEIIKENLSQTLLFYDNAVWDFAFGPDGEVFVSIANKDTIGKLIKQIGLRPHVFEAEPYALVRAASYFGHSEALIMDFGATKTTFAGFKNNLLNSCRVLLKSANSLVNEIANINNITEKEALQIMKKDGFKNTLVEEFFKSLFAIAFPTNERPPYSKILISGQICALGYAREFLKAYFGLPVEEIAIISKSKDSYDTAAYGAALKYAAKEHGVNLAPYKIEEGVNYKKLALLVLIPLLLLLTDVKYKESVQAHRYNALNKKIIEVIKRDFPNTKNFSYPVSVYKSLLTGYLGAAETGATVLDMLGYISGSLTASVKINSIDYTNPNFSVTGRANSVKQVEDFKSALARNFKNIEITEIRNVGESVNFTIRMNI